MRFRLFMLVMTSIAMLVGCVPDTSDDRAALEERLSSLERRNADQQAQIAELEVQAVERIQTQQVPTMPKRSCPSHKVDEVRLHRILAVVIDASNRDKFDAWDGDDGSVEATFSYNGTYYKVFYSVTVKTFVSFWERTDRPFVVGGDIDLMGSNTYTDENLDGCLNFGIGYERDAPDKMQWSAEGDPNYDWQIWEHAPWQVHYLRAFEALNSTLDFAY